jgi:ribosomal protein S14
MKIKDKSIRHTIHTFELQRLILKALNKRFYAMPNGLAYQGYVTLKLARLPRSSSKTQANNRCVLTNRSHSVLRKFRISRICLRELANAGLLPGVTKSSW